MSFLPTLLKYEFAIEDNVHPLDKYKEDHEVSIGFIHTDDVM